MPFSINKSRNLCCAALLVLLSIASQPLPRAQDLGAPFVPTPQDVVYRMYEMAGLQAGDYVIDLGSGDGRLVITAAQMGAAGHGIEKRPDLIEEATQNARQAGVDDRVMFLEGDIFEADLTGASIVTLYLLPEINIQLRPKLLRELEPGARVVSHSFNMGEWQPDLSAMPDEVHHVYLWIIPARLQGRWNWEIGDDEYVMDVEQNFQKLKLNIMHDSLRLESEEVTLSGPRISFLVKSGTGSTLYSGVISGDEIKGIAQVHEKEELKIEKWLASREIIRR